MTKNRKSSRIRLATRQTGRGSHHSLPAGKAAIAAAVITALATLAAAALALSDKPATTQPTSSVSPSASASAVAAASPPSRPSATPLPTKPLVPGDDSTFITDVTYPDGSTVTEGHHFIKKWEIKNIGDVLWSGRYLAPTGSYTGSCTYPSRVPVPLTRPDQDVIISVPVTASASPGLCFVTWKMVTSTGILYFPNEIGIWFKVNVIPPPAAPTRNAQSVT